MADSDRVKPLAPASSFQTSGDFLAADEALAVQLNLRRKQNHLIKCCGCITAVISILSVTVLVLFFTVFHVKDPAVSLNAVTIQNLDRGTNVTFTADVSVKNPNVATFKYQNGTVAIYHRGAVVGEARVPAGKAGARQTVRVNLTANLAFSDDVYVDVAIGAVPVSGYVEIGGVVRIVKLVEQFVVVKLNCTMVYNCTSKMVQDTKCTRHVHV